MKRMICVLLALVFLLSLPGCGSKDDRLKDLDAVQNAGVLKVGVTDCIPFVWNNQGNWQGFDAELAEAVGQKLGVTVEFVEIPWEQRWEQLEQGSVDLIWCCVTATDQLAGLVDLSQSYLASRPVLVVPAGSVDKDQFTGMKIAAEKDSACALAAEACLGSVDLMRVDSQQTAADAMFRGEAEGAVVDLTFAQALLSREPNLVLRTDLEMGTEELKVALRKNSDLTEAIDKALTELQSEDVMDSLAEKYGLRELLVVG